MGSPGAQRARARWPLRRAAGSAWRGAQGERGSKNDDDDHACASRRSVRAPRLSEPRGERRARAESERPRLPPWAGGRAKMQSQPPRRQPNHAALPHCGAPARPAASRRAPEPLTSSAGASCGASSAAGAPLLLPLPPEHRARLLVRVGLVRHRGGLPARLSQWCRASGSRARAGR
ncbi:unnamed protein product, partial [Prorocentrum cordatum]